MTRKLKILIEPLPVIHTLVNAAYCLRTRCFKGSVRTPKKGQYLGNMQLRC